MKTRNSFLPRTLFILILAGFAALSYAVETIKGQLVESPDLDVTSPGLCRYSKSLPHCLSGKVCVSQTFCIV